MRRLVLALALLLTQTLAAAAEERAELFRAEIVIAADGTMHVAETIDVTVEGIVIKHGLYRDVPAEDGLEIEAIRRDGVPEPYVVEPNGGSLRIKIGRGDVLLPHGLHHYEIIYRRAAPLTRMANADGLFYPVTGAWNFVFMRAEVSVTLPQAAVISDSFAMVNRKHGDTTAVSPVSVTAHSFSAATGSRLEIGDVFGIGLMWQKGVVAEGKVSL